MGQFAGTTFGIGTPSLYPVPQNPFGGSGYGFGQGYGSGQYGVGTVPPIHQIAQLVQILPQQLQQLQILQQQQLTQSVPHQLQQQWQQPFGSGVVGPIGFGVSPQPFAGQSASHVM
jgi:hypothetical protein